MPAGWHAHRLLSMLPFPPPKQAGGRKLLDAKTKQPVTQLQPGQKMFMIVSLGKFWMA